MNPRIYVPYLINYVKEFNMYVRTYYIPRISIINNSNNNLTDLTIVYFKIYSLPVLRVKGCNTKLGSFSKGGVLKKLGYNFCKRII